MDEILFGRRLNTADALLAVLVSFVLGFFFGKTDFSAGSSSSIDDDHSSYGRFGHR